MSNIRRIYSKRFDEDDTLDNFDKAIYNIFPHPCSCKKCVKLKMKWRSINNSNNSNNSNSEEVEIENQLTPEIKERLEKNFKSIYSGELRQHFEVYRIHLGSLTPSCKISESIHLTLKKSFYKGESLAFYYYKMRPLIIDKQRTDFLSRIIYSPFYLLIDTISIGRRTLINIIIGCTQLGEKFLLHTYEYKKNETDVSKLILKCFKKELKNKLTSKFVKENFRFIITNGEKEFIDAVKTVKTKFQNLKHFICFAYIFDKIFSKIKEENKILDNFVNNFHKIAKVDESFIAEMECKMKLQVNLTKPKDFYKYLDFVDFLSRNFVKMIYHIEEHYKWADNYCEIPNEVDWLKSIKEAIDSEYIKKEIWRVQKYSFLSIFHWILISKFSNFQDLMKDLQKLKNHKKTRLLKFLLNLSEDYEFFHNCDLKTERMFNKCPINLKEVEYSFQALKKYETKFIEKKNIEELADCLFVVYNKNKIINPFRENDYFY